MPDHNSNPNPIVHFSGSKWLTNQQSAG